MDELNMTVRYFDSLTGKTIEVPVTEEVGTYIRRSYWRESKQESRFRMRVCSMEVLSEDYVSRYLEKTSIIEELLLKQECKNLRKCIADLSEQKKELLHLIYDEGYNASNAGIKLGMSASSGCRLFQKVKRELRDELLKMEGTEL